MKKSRKPESFIEPITYPGGNESLRKFIIEHLRYPEKALQNKTEGTVVVKADINAVGKVIAAHVIKSVPDGCDDEALRLVKLMKFNPVKRKSGLRVTYHKNININFALKSTTLEQPVEIKINFQPSASSSQAPSTNPVVYTIKIERKS
ncbi:MAG TPA: energy transducer TonB [Bacteroidia bacterium]|nr:energy transducer TonB [Bacteroidia bacterium]HNT80103.1 energy transducer TonB [Bacteroidia bacterium]